METRDITNILGIMTNLISGDRKIDQEWAEVRDFKVATSKLITRLIETASVETAPWGHGPDTVFKAINDHR
jgi:hypothetical protein